MKGVFFRGDNVINKPIFIEIDKPIEIPIHSVQFDKNSRFINVYLLNNSLPLDVTRYTVTVAGVKPDGQEFFNECDKINSEEGLVRFEITEQMNVSTGIVNCEIKVYSDSEGVLTTKPFSIKVTRSLLKSDIESTGEFRALTEAISKVQGFDNKLVDLRNDTNEKFAQTNAQLSQIEDSKATKLEVDVERTRIDNIVKNEGTSVDDLELQDIRTDVFGKVHDSAGDAVREQVRKISSFAKVDKTKKLLDATFTPDYGCIIVSGDHALTTGVGTQNANTGYVELTEEVYMISIDGADFGAHPNLATFAFYDANKNYISGTNTSTVTSVPKGALYVAIGNFNVNSTHTDVKVTFHRYEALKTMDDNAQLIHEIINNNHVNIHPMMTPGQWLQDGTLIVNDNQDLSTSDFIEIPLGTVSLQCKIGVFASASVISFYDEGKRYISCVVDVKADTIPEDARYIRLSNYSLALPNVPHSEVSYTFKTIKRLIDAENKIDRLIEEIGNNTSSKWNGKKWCVIGDSITEDNFRAEKHYWSYINEETGITIINKGISGTGYKQHLPFYERILDNDFPTDCDVITMMGGINDVVGWDNELPIGDVTDNDNTTICGCVNLAIDAIESKYPIHAPLGIVSPLPADVDLTVFPNARFPRQYPSLPDCRLEEFTVKLEKICKRRGYPFLDLFHTSGLRPWNEKSKNELFKPKEGYGQADGLHPNSNGQKKIYPKYLEFIKTILVK